MDPVVALAALFVITYGVVLWALMDPKRKRPSEREVLPSHYSSLLEIDPSRYPGLCASCGTSNTPGYRFCKECGDEIPGHDRATGTRPVSRIFED